MRFLNIIKFSPKIWKFKKTDRMTTSEIRIKQGLLSGYMLVQDAILTPDTMKSTTETF